MDVKSFIMKITGEWEKFQVAVSPLGQEDWLRGGVDGVMSMKDVLAHITWYEGQMVNVITRRALLGSEWWDLPLDERNARILAELKDSPLDEVRRQANEVHRQMMAGLATLTERELNDAACFAGMPAEWLPWEMIASNTYEHYPQHMSGMDKLRVANNN